MNNYIIKTKKLSKKYKSFIAVNEVSLNIRKGSIYGFLGPNGAGKSTTMKMLLGLTAPTKGSFEIDGKKFPDDRIAILKEVGSFIESPAFYGNLTGRERSFGVRRPSCKKIFIGNEAEIGACRCTPRQTAYFDFG